MKKILVVEDDPVNAMILGDYLSASGYEVTVARTGPEGVERFHLEQPDLMLVDVMLPRKNGFEVAFDVKRTLHGRSMPLIFMSAVYRDEEHGTQYAQRGLSADAYVTKPFELSRMLDKVRTLLGEPALPA